MSSANYRLHRLFWFFWRWEVERDGQISRRGWALSRSTARWRARNSMRALAARPPTDAGPSHSDDG